MSGQTPDPITPERCPNDGQTLAWHRAKDASGRSNGSFIGCPFGLKTSGGEPVDAKQPQSRTPESGESSPSEPVDPYPERKWAENRLLFDQIAAHSASAPDPERVTAVERNPSCSSSTTDAATPSESGRSAPRQEGTSSGSLLHTESHQARTSGSGAPTPGMSEGSTSASAAATPAQPSRFCSTGANPAEPLVTPERVTLTEAERAALTWVTPVDNDDTDVYAAVERILSDRLRATSEREARLRALADEWNGYGHGKFNIHLEDALPCSVCDLLAQLRALLDGDEETTT